MTNTVSSKVLGKLLGNITARAVNLLAGAGTITREIDGEFTVARVVPEYCKFLRARGGASAGVAEQRERLLKIQADNAALNLEERRGELINPTELLQSMSYRDSVVRTRLLAIPSRCAVLLAAATTPAECFKITQDNIHEAMHELVDWFERAVEKYSADGVEIDWRSAPRGDEPEGWKPDTADTPEPPAPITIGDLAEEAALPVERLIAAAAFHFELTAETVDEAFEIATERTNILSEAERIAELARCLAAVCGDTTKRRRKARQKPRTKPKETKR